MLKGYSLPLSPGGRSSLVPSPPWHYVGDLMVIEYWPTPTPFGRSAARAWSRTRPIRAGRRRSSPTGRAAPTAELSCSTRHAASTWSSSSSSTRCSTARRSRPARTSGSIATSHSCAAGSRAFPEARIGLDDAPLRPPERRRAGSSQARRSEACSPPTTAACTGDGDAREHRPTPGRRTTPRSSSNVRHFPRLDAGLHDKPRCTSSPARSAATAPPRRSGRARPRSICSARPTRSTPRSPRCAWARAFASRSPTRSTISRTRAT